MEKQQSARSGAAKKRKLKRQQESLSKIPRMTQFLKPVVNKEEIPSTSRGVEEFENDDSDVKNTSDSGNAELNCSITDIHKENSETGGILSTDIADYQDKILTDDVKKTIILSDSCRPRGPFKRDPSQHNRMFSEEFYRTSTTYGFIERLWLCYSPKLDAAYCEPCWLFSTDKNESWRKKGVRDWQGLSKKIKVHEKSQHHVRSCCIYEKWKNNQTIDTYLEEQIRYESNFWVQVLERLVNITLMLSKNCLSFRGHREKLYEEYNGNFLSQAELLSKYDNVMKQVLTMPNGTTKYLSHQIQNEIIHCLATRLKATLVAEIKNAPFYSIIMDTTQDITKRDQLSQVFRYLKIILNDKNEPTSFEIREVFLGFNEIRDHSADGLYQETLNLLKINDISLSNCRGQAYDGASVMSGAYNGVQALLRNDAPNALYVHCASHNLNLVINDAVKSSKKVATFFAQLENIYSYFGNSIKRWDLLSQFTGESKITLKRLNPTRWAGRYTSLLAVKLRFLDIMKALTELSLRSSKKDEREEALRLQNNINTFEFVFLCVLLSKVLTEVHIPSTLLQTQNLDIMTATNSLQTASTHLKQHRNQYSLLKDEAIQIAEKWKINPTFSCKRQKLVKKHFDELSYDHRFEHEDDFRVNVFNFVLDIVINQIEKRFQGMHEVSTVFAFLAPTQLVKLQEQDILKSAEALQLKYKEDLSAEFPLQTVMIATMLRDEIVKISTIKDLAELLFIKYSTISSSFSEVLTALFLFLTLPVTVATAERSFSKLKIIKNYLRSSTGQERLHNLSLLGIEAKLAKQMEIKDVIRDFANMKSRKMNFKF